MFFSLQQTPARRRVIFFLVALALALTVAARQTFLTLTTGAGVPFSRANAGERGLDYWQNRAQSNPGDRQAQAQLGLAYLQQVRQTGDVSLYVQAEQAFNNALPSDAADGRNPYSIRDLNALIGQGMLALSRHDFEGALLWGEQARALNPHRAQVLGILVDANVELGRYDEALENVQAMVDLRPDLASYSRVSYVRELFGDVDGAVVAMEQAISAGVPGAEETAWAQVQLGNLYLERGELDKAQALFLETLHYRPDYPYALVGMARVRVQRGQPAAAIGEMQQLVERLPTPGVAILLGELYEATGQPAAAARQYDLARSLFDQEAAAGANVEMEYAFFEANHGDPRQALALARAAYAQRKGIVAADTLAWALFKNGQLDEAWRYSQESLRLGTQDAHLHARAVIIARAMGDEEAAARHLAAAQAIDPAIDVQGSTMVFRDVTAE